jgi:hypothetical protein
MKWKDKVNIDRPMETSTKVLNYYKYKYMLYINMIYHKGTHVNSVRHGKGIFIVSKGKTY